MDLNTAEYKKHLVVFLSGEVAQWLAPRICSANHEVFSSNLTVNTDDPLG